jgi:hypothetical protein
MIVFHDRIYKKHEGQLYVFESVWDSFRPIEKVAWNGEQFEIVDSKYKTNLFAENYGYGSLKQVSRTMTQETELGDAVEMKDPVAFWRWCGETDVKWWKDRPVVFASKCVSRDGWKTYLNYIESRAKTLRRPFKGRTTRRLVPV